MGICGDLLCRESSDVEPAFVTFLGLVTHAVSVTTNVGATATCKKHPRPSLRQINLACFRISQ